MSANTKHRIAFSLAMLALVMTSTMPWQAQAGDNITIKLPVPPIPKISLPFPPPMVWLPVPQVYVARGTPQHIFYRENRYYLFHENQWYIGPGYEGPWAVIRVDLLPPGLRTYRARDWDDYQEEAYRRHRDHDDDDDHHAFYGHRGDHRRYERALWADWQREHGDRGWHGHDDRGEDHGHGHGRGSKHDG